MHIDAKLKLLGMGLLAITASASFILPKQLSVPASIAADPLPDAITLTGILRDFDTTHGDFGVVPTKGLGHYAGTVAPSLGPDDRPVFSSGTGYLVEEEWRGVDGTPIAPHLHETSPLMVNGPAFFVNGKVTLRQGTLSGAVGGGILVTNSTAANGVDLRSGATIDGSVYIGPGGDPDMVVSKDGNSKITGEIGVLGTPFEMPTVTAPTGMPASQGDKTYSGGFLTGDLHFDTLTIRQNRAVIVSGTTRILCDEFAMGNNSDLILAPGATLEMYVHNNADLRNNTSFNAFPGDSSDATIYFLGSGTITVSNSHALYASVIGPNVHLHVENSAKIHGSFQVDQLTLEDGSSGLEMMEGATVGKEEGCGIYDDASGTQGVSNNGAISSESSFDQWFKDDLDANLSVPYPLTFTNDGSGNYLLVDKDFYPLDDQVKGNEGADHNSHFTYTLTANFEYESCTGQYVEFQGGDGAWIFIDERMAIDLGGVQAGQYQRFELDRFGLTDGETYQFHLFYANRNTSGSTFGIRTNLLLWQAPFMATATNPFD